MPINLIARGMMIFLGLTLTWAMLAAVFSLPSYILPTPWQVFIAWSQDIRLITSEAVPTIIETLSGLCVGTLFGIVAALVMAFFKPVKVWMLPILIISQAIPTFAIAPLLVIWFGYGMISKIVTTIIMLFFPITSALFDGLRRTHPGWLDLAKTMQASSWRVFWHIRIPAALPYFASGLRIATVVAPIGAVIGEWVGASRGLGFLMLTANARMQIDLMFAALFTLIIFSLLLYVIIDKLLRRYIYWSVESL